MHKYRLLILAYLFFCLTGFGKVWGQVYTTTGTSANWNDPSAWILSNPSGCAILNGGPPPPRTLNAGNPCPVKIIINHPITYTGNSTIGGGYMDSLIINTGGNLTFTGNLSVNNVGNSAGPLSFTIRGGGIFNVTGNFTNDNNGTSIRVQSSGVFNVGGNYTTTGTSTSLNIDDSSSLIVNGTTTINSNHSLSVTGNFTTNNLSTGSGGTILFNGSSKITVNNTFTHSNGSLSLSSTSNLFIGGNLDLSGSAILNLSGDTDIKVSGNLNLTNGTINNSGNGDIRVDGNLSMSGGGSYNGSNNGYIQINGNHVISSNNPVNLSGDSKFVTLGDRTGGFWSGPSLSDNACYSSNNLPNSFCLPCSTVYSSDGTFYVPVGVTEITIEIVGGGGRGGNRSTAGRSGGGGGGAYSRITIPVTPGEPLGIFVGEGGNSINSNGGTTYVTRDPNLPIDTGSIIYAGGGMAGADGGASTLSGGLGGIRDTRSNIFSSLGGNGASGTNSGSGGGGSSGGASNSGNNGANPTGGADPAGIGGPGGNGNNNNNSDGSAPTLGFGGGGGGGRRVGTNGNGGSGSPGYVYISYTCPTNASCSNIISFGTTDGYTIIEYRCDGIWNAPEGLLEFEVLAIGGGAGGGGRNDGGGGGAGGVVYAKANIESRFSMGLPAGINYAVQVGSGGSGGTSANNSNSIGTDGDDTSFDLGGDYSIISGGGGGGGSTSNGNGRNGKPSSIASTAGFGTGQMEGILRGGAGGGRRRALGSGVGIGSNGAGNGSNGGNSGNGSGGGGGGVNGTAGGSGNDNNGRPGGSGMQFSTTIFKTAEYFSAGGGGGGNSGGAGGNSGAGGNGGANGNGQPGSTPGSGGGGASGDSNTGGRGSDGRVYIRYPIFRILPVEFLYFNAIYSRVDRLGNLSWATAQEWENSHFEIERSINDARNWTKVGEVSSQGYSDFATEYSFTDSNLPASGGNIFYRLKQVDLNGDFGYSVTKAIQVEALDGSTFWNAYPNPSSMGSTVTVDLLDKSRFSDGVIQIRISDARGISYTYSDTSPEEVTALVNSYLNQTRPGLHILQLFWADQSEVIKLIRN